MDTLRRAGELATLQARQRQLRRELARVEREIVHAERRALAAEKRIANLIPNPRQAA
jgi:predicted  nucleic acid-binding Zn-ribbon protein